MHYRDASLAIALYNNQRAKSPYTVTIAFEEINAACSDELVINMKGIELPNKDW